MKYKKEMIVDYLKHRCIDKRWIINNNFCYKIARIIIESIKLIPIFLKIIFFNHIYVRQVELVVTTRCSLRCKDCANLMQYYSRPYDIDTDKLLVDVKRFLAKVDKVGDFRILGGEPFLYQNLSELLRLLIGQKKIEKITFFTNATILPQNDIIPLLSNKKINLFISNYGLKQQKLDSFARFCDENRINYFIKSQDLKWGYVGEPKAHARAPQLLQRQFMRCNNTCRSILNGKLFYCPRSAHLDDLNIAKALDGECVVIDEKMTSEKILNIIYRNRFIKACDYCNYGTDEMVPIPPGIQKEL